MKKINVQVTLLAITFMILLASFDELKGIQEVQEKLFVGTWVDEEDSNHKWVFTKGQLTIKYTGSEDDVYTYKISTAGLQCGHQVSQGGEYYYLEIVNTNDLNDKTCYIVNGFAEVTPGRKTLSLSQVGRGGYTLFIKQ